MCVSPKYIGRATSQCVAFCTNFTFATVNGTDVQICEPSTDPVYPTIYCDSALLVNEQLVYYCADNRFGSQILQFQKTVKFPFDTDFPAYDTSNALIVKMEIIRNLNITVSVTDGYVSDTFCIFDLVT